jgi:hypothetical protein
MILTLEEAAVVLSVDPDTVRLWEQRVGCPTRLGVGDGRWGYVHDELIALRAALDTTLSIASAVAKVRGESTRGREGHFGRLYPDDDRRSSAAPSRSDPQPLTIATASLAPNRVPGPNSPGTPLHASLHNPAVAGRSWLAEANPSGVDCRGSDRYLQYQCSK